MTGAFARAVVRADPQTAFALAPGNGRVAAAHAQQAFLLSLDPGDASAPARIAQRALRQDPTAVAAVNVLALQAQLRNDTADAGRLFRYSTLLSRREFRPQIWAIEDAVNRGDIRQALRHYDNALRTSRDAPELLFPALAAAVAEPRIRAATIDVLRREPNWTQDFITYVAVSGVDTVAGVAFLQAARAAGLPVSNDTRAGLVNALIRDNRMDQAWDYYRTFRAGADRRRSRDPDFSFRSDTRAWFEWTTGDQPNIAAAILDEGDSGVLDFAVPAGTGGTLVQQTELLPPGAYRLQGRSRGVDQPAHSSPYWVLRCQDGRELGRVDVSNGRDDGRFAGTFTVPDGCRSQTLALVARASDQVGGVSGQILNAALVPLE